MPDEPRQIYWDADVFLSYVNGIPHWDFEYEIRHRQDYDDPWGRGSATSGSTRATGRVTRRRGREVCRLAGAGRQSARGQAP